MRRKYSPEEKIKIVEGYINGEYTMRAKALELGYKDTPGCFKRWYEVYLVHGREGLYYFEQYSSYTKEFKQKVVEEYLSGVGSAVELAAKYKISTADILLRWVNAYKSNKPLTDYNQTNEIYGTQKRRKVLINERDEIIAYCLAHNKDYRATAIRYNVSYEQIYSWVRKYLKNSKI